jgi:hypothetical protein
MGPIIITNIEDSTNSDTFDTLVKLIFRHRNKAFGILRTTDGHDRRSKALKIKFMAFIFRLMEQGMLHEDITEYVNGGTSYGSLNWDRFWGMYNNIDFDYITKTIEKLYKEDCEQALNNDQYEAEMGDIHYEDYMNNKFWGK